MQNLHIFFKENAMQNRNFMLEVVCFWIPLEDSIILLSIMGQWTLRPISIVGAGSSKPVWDV